MTDLIARLEKAEEGSREFDWAIFDDGVRNEPAPPYTTSVDAALTLIPEGLSWEVRKSGFGNPAQCTLWDPMKQPPTGTHPRVDHNQGSAPLAIVIAALKARSMGNG